MHLQFIDWLALALTAVFLVSGTVLLIVINRLWTGNIAQSNPVKEQWENVPTA